MDGTKTKAKVYGDTKCITLKGKPTLGQQLTSYFIKRFALRSSGIADYPLFVVVDDHTDPEKIDDHMDTDVNVTVHLRHVYRKKYNKDGSTKKNKARLVVLGYGQVHEGMC